MRAKGRGAAVSDFRVRIQSSTSPAAPLSVVNGPAAARAGVAAADGCFGPGAGANVAIGRAVRLVMTLVGEARPGGGDPSPLGAPAKIGSCFAEREDASPWPSLGRRRGVTGESAVTAFAITGCWQISEPSTSVDDVVHQVLHGMINPGSAASCACRNRESNCCSVAIDRRCGPARYPMCTSSSERCSRRCGCR
jgi:hypothetical protein